MCYLFLKGIKMVLCGKELNVGDYVEVQYTTGNKYSQLKGGVVTGNITKLWEDAGQGQVNHGWCFHDHDKILEHKPVTVRK